MTLLSKERRITGLLYGTFLMLTGMIVILSWVPPVDRDALTHHLFIPKLYLKHGGIYEIPNIPFSYYPMNLDLLYLIPLYFGNDIIPKFIHFLFALLTAFLIYKYLRKRVGLNFALFGALFFLSIPVIVKLSITVYVDLGLIFFTTASLLSLLKWLETDKIRWIVLSAAMCGLAMGTKYNGLISFFLITLSIPLIYLRYPDKKEQSQGKAMGFACLFLVVSLVLFSPWIIRNYIWKKNPVYPLYNKWFQKVEVQIETDDEKQKSKPTKGLTPFALRKLIYQENGWQILAVPLRIFFEGKDDDPKHFDGKLNPFLLIFPIVFFLGIRNMDQKVRFETLVFVSFSVLFLLIVFFQSDMRIRYTGPMIPPLVILSVYGFRQAHRFMTNKFSQSLSTILSALIVTVALLPNCIYIQDQFNKVDPLPFISGKISRGAYIERYRPEYRLIQHINQNLAESSKILFLFIGNRGYYSDRDVFFGQGWLEKQLQKAGSLNDLKRGLRNSGVTHLLVRLDLLNWWIQEGLPQTQGKIVAEFLAGSKRIGSHQDYALYEL